MKQLWETACGLGVLVVHEGRQRGRTLEQGNLLGLISKTKINHFPSLLMAKGKQHTLGMLKATFTSVCSWILAWTCWRWPTKQGFGRRAAPRWILLLFPGNSRYVARKVVPVEWPGTGVTGVGIWWDLAAWFALPQGNLLRHLVDWGSSVNSHHNILGGIWNSVVLPGF